MSGLYTLARDVPLAQSPALRAPPYPALPAGELHALPPSVGEYFVYDFSLESFVLAPPPPALGPATAAGLLSASTAPRLRIAQLRDARTWAARRIASHTAEVARRRSAFLQHAAPGWQPEAVLVPEPRRAPAPAAEPHPTPAPRPEPKPEPKPEPEPGAQLGSEHASQADALPRSTASPTPSPPGSQPGAHTTSDADELAALVAAMQ